jgi:hypothetical protein
MNTDDFEAKQAVEMTVEQGRQWVDGELDPELEQALRNFRSSVHSWSEEAHSRPRTVGVTYRRRVWRLAAGWALGCVLAAGAVTAGIYQFEHRQELARQTAAAAAERQRQAIEQNARVVEAQRVQLSVEDEQLLAMVDSDVSREVPAAMEALTPTVAEDESE